MSDNYYYQEGAIHNDNKQVMNVTVTGKVDVSAIIKVFFYQRCRGRAGSSF